MERRQSDAEKKGRAAESDGNPSANGLELLYDARKKFYNKMYVGASPMSIQRRLVAHHRPIDRFAV